MQKSVPNHQAYSDIQLKMRGSQVEMRADILDKNGHWPRLRGATLSPILTYLCPLSLFSCQMYGFPARKPPRENPEEEGTHSLQPTLSSEFPTPVGLRLDRTL